MPTETSSPSGGAANRLGLALQLCALRYLGFVARNLSAAPRSAACFVADQLEVSPDEIQSYARREETLKAAFSALVDFQHQLPLAEAWGGGTLSSSDGQRFPVRGSAENATALPKYFGLGRGLTFYTWTSDQYSQYGSKVISSTVRDAT